MWRILVLAFCACAERQLVRPRVYHGQDDMNKEFPFVVSMEHKDGTRICTCSLIAEKWIITAGHSVKRHSNTHRWVKYADFTSNETKAYSNIIKVFRHPGYFFSRTTDISARNNLALVLIGKVPLKTFAKLSAIDYKSLLGFPVKFAGFGNTVSHKLTGVIIPDDELRALQVGEAVVITCAHMYPIFGPAICVAPKCSNKLQDTRKGDGGGPLVYRGKLVGVMIGCETDLPIAYATPVSPYLKWISDVLKQYS